jgi:hypothetical protein
MPVLSNDEGPSFGRAWEPDLLHGKGGRTNRCIHSHPNPLPEREKRRGTMYLRSKCMVEST